MKTPWLRGGRRRMLDLEGLRPYVLGSEYARIVRQAAIPPQQRTIKP
jgi:hypothetical protein